MYVYSGVTRGLLSTPARTFVVPAHCERLTVVTLGHFNRSFLFYTLHRPRSLQTLRVFIVMTFLTTLLTRKWPGYLYVLAPPLYVYRPNHGAPSWRRVRQRQCDTYFNARRRHVSGSGCIPCWNTPSPAVRVWSSITSFCRKLKCTLFSHRL